MMPMQLQTTCLFLLQAQWRCHHCLSCLLAAAAAALVAIVSACRYAIVLPLPFCLQLVAQLAAVAVYQRRLATTSCSKLMLDPAMLPMLHSFWGSCRKALAALLMLLGITGDAEIAFWAAGGGAASAINALDAGASHVTVAVRIRDDIAVCHQTVMLMLVVFGVLLPLPLCYLWELRLRKQFYAQELLAAEDVQQRQQQQQQQQASNHNTVASFSSSSSQVLRGDEPWQDAFHMPVVVLVQYILALSMIGVLGLLKLGPFLL
jgi:hypothetical protein